MTEPQVLTHDLADDVLTAVQRGRISVESLPSILVAYSIGPAIELALSMASDPIGAFRCPPWSASNELVAFFRAWRAGKTVWAPFSSRLGFFRTVQLPGARDEMEYVSFLARASQAAETSGFSRRTAKALVGAMGEIEDNIYEHSNYHQSGIVAFQAGPGVFSFVVADGGIGVLASLRQSSQFKALDDHGDALRLVLTEGVSRFSNFDNARGMGFHDLFVGIANLRGHLRFASGDHALIIDGRTPTLTAHRLVQKSPFQGFVVSVTCQS